MKSPEKNKRLATNWSINNTLLHNEFKKTNVLSHKKSKSLITNWAINNTLQCNDSIKAARLA